VLSKTSQAPAFAQAAAACSTSSLDKSTPVCVYNVHSAEYTHERVLIHKKGGHLLLGSTSVGCELGLYACDRDANMWICAMASLRSTMYGQAWDFFIPLLLCFRGRAMQTNMHAAKVPKQCKNLLRSVWNTNKFRPLQCSKHDVPILLLVCVLLYTFIVLATILLRLEHLRMQTKYCTSATSPFLDLKVF
jgi:hypothetical protein